MSTNGNIIDRRIDRAELGELAPATAPEPKGMIDVAQTRAAQEVQAAMVVAKRFPRDQTAAYARIMDACKRPSLADRAMYAYPRGGETVTGPSIRLAEVLAQNWGNIDFGVVELEQKFGESVVMSYAWDLETNTRQAKVFTVRHERHTKSGKKTLTDPRDIYELVANQAARRLRACILGVIPGDIIDASLEQCEKTLDGKSDEPLAELIRKMKAAFEALGVTQEQLEARVGHKIDACTRVEVRNLGKVYNSIKDGHAPPSAYFDATNQQQQATAPAAAGLAAKIAPPLPTNTVTPSPAVEKDTAHDALDGASERSDREGAAEVQRLGGKSEPRSAEQLSGNRPPASRDVPAADGPAAGQGSAAFTATDAEAQSWHAFEAKAVQIMRTVHEMKEQPAREYIDSLKLKVKGITENRRSANEVRAATLCKLLNNGSHE